MAAGSPAGATLLTPPTAGRQARIAVTPEGLRLNGQIISECYLELMWGVGRWNVEIPGESGRIHRSVDR